MEQQVHDAVVTAILFVAVPTFLVLLKVDAPYGRHTRPGWGPTMPARLGWIVMESPAVLLFIAIYLRGEHASGLVPLALLTLWQVHYVHRAFVYPLRRRDRRKRMPVAVAIMAIVFNCANAYINARWISHFGDYADAWLRSPAFIAGVSLFIAGFAINQHADRVLRALRRPGESGYRIPQGGLYRWVSCPNYLGELVEWIGWAIATWSLAGLAFATFTAANLVPRALAHHRWYRDEFDDYPPGRRALIPGIL